MVEGWHNDEYLILFDDAEGRSLSIAYAITSYLTNYRLIGLRSWDDFIVADAANATFTVPTVPLVDKYLEPYSLPANLELLGDQRFVGRIKWNLKPIVFGGAPDGEKNWAWVSLSEHTELVKFWNAQYREATSGN